MTADRYTGVYEGPDGKPMGSCTECAARFEETEHLVLIERHDRWHEQGGPEIPVAKFGRLTVAQALGFPDADLDEHGYIKQDPMDSAPAGE